MNKIVYILIITTILSGCLGPNVRKPRPEVPFEYQIGWWPYQDNLKVETFRVTTLDSRLCLFNSTSLVELIIEGTIKSSNGWKPVIKSAHLSERVIKGGNFIDSIAEFHITPVISVVKDSKYKSAPIHFNIKQELHCKSMGWGKNVFRFICNNKTQEIVLYQSK